MDDAQRSCGCAQGDGFDAGVRQRGDISQRPGGGEQTALARIEFGQANTQIVRIWRPGRAMRIVATADAAGADAMRGCADEAARGPHLVRQGLKGLHHRPVIGGMDDRTGGVDDEVEVPHRHALAIQLGEESEHAAAQPDTGKGFARCRIELFKRWCRWARSAGQHGFQVTDRNHRDRRWLQAGLPDLIGKILQFGLILIDARDHDLQHAIRAGRLAQDAVTVQLLEAVLLAGVDMADQKARRGELEQIESCDGGSDFLGRHTHADGLQGRARDAAQFDLNAFSARLFFSGLRLAREQEFDRLRNFLTGPERVRPGQDQRTHVGLEGRIGPVAVVFHFEGVSLHAHRRLEAGQHFVGQRTDIEHRLNRIYFGWKACLFCLAVHMLHFQRNSGHAFQRMEHHEPGTCGQEVGLRGRAAIEYQAIRRAFDVCVIGDFLIGAFAHRVKGNGKSFGALVDLQIADDRCIRAPVLIAHQKSDRAQYLDAVDPEVAQLAVVKLDRQRPGLEYLSRCVRLLCAAQGDCTGRIQLLHGFLFAGSRIHLMTGGQALPQPGKKDRYRSVPSF